MISLLRYCSIHNLPSWYSTSHTPPIGRLEGTGPYSTIGFSSASGAAPAAGMTATVMAPTAASASTLRRGLARIRCLNLVLELTSGSSLWVVMWLSPH